MRAGWLRLANAWKVLGENAADAYGHADTLAPVNPRILADWAEAHVRQLSPGAVPSAQAVAVLERLKKAEPRNALALFYLGIAAEAAGYKPAALQCWKTLLALLPANAPIRGMLEGADQGGGGGEIQWMNSRPASSSLRSQEYHPKFRALPRNLE